MIKALRDRRANVWEEAKSLADSASEQNRAFSAEEQGTWDALNDELDKLDKRVKSALDTEQRAKNADEAFAKLEAKPQTRGGREQTSVDSGEFLTQLRAFARGDNGAPRAFNIQSDGPARIEARTLSRLSTGAGGSLVPTTMYERLMAHLIEVSAILQAGATVINTNSGEPITVPKTTAHSTAILYPEAGTLTGNDPAFAQVSLGAYKYGVLVQVSRELIDDNGFDLEGYLAMETGRALGNAFGADLITGTGTSMPTGLLSGTTLGVTGASGIGGGLGPTSATGNSGADLLFDLFYSVIAPYRASQACGWLVKDSTMAALRKVKDTTGQYIFQPSLVAGTPDMLVGKPVYTDPFIPTIASGAKSIVFGDFSQYFARIAGGVRFERSDDFAFSSDLVTFRALIRGDGNLVDRTGAVKHFLGG
jgi:HK97 family phage major capsid protein